MGEIIGSMLAAYVICRILEWVILKRVIRNHAWMVVVSAIAVGALFLVAFRYRAEALGSFDSNDERLLGAQIIAVILLPIIRILWKKLRPKVESSQEEAV